jgi:hypothetical protein
MELRANRQSSHMKVVVWVCLILLVVFGSFSTQVLEIPKTWDVAAIEESHIPPPDTSARITYAPEEYYNSLPEHVIYKSFPVYAVEASPPGYLDSLKTLEPEIVFDLSKLKTEADWIKAGEKIFFWPTSFVNVDSTVIDEIDSAYLAGTGEPVTPKGIYPYYSYVVKNKGELLLGILACSNCHTRVMENGNVIVGAQGNHAFDASFGYAMKRYNIPVHIVNPGIIELSAAPWIDTPSSVGNRTQQEVIDYLRACPTGVMSRQGMAFDRPIKVPSLIGIKEIKYLDHTGLMRHRGPGDLMRYAALNQGMDLVTSYGGYIPIGTNDHKDLPGLDEWNNPFGYDPFRYTDAQLYALTQFIYSLTPPENPHHFPDALLARGERIFIEQGCITCHTPPLFTNNKLTPVTGFDPPAMHFEKYDVFNVSVETDATSSLTSRRGTGYYKIPSLLGVWYRGPFFHNGELATLEDVFDPARLSDDYVPTGYKPPGITTRAVKGHEFGMEISDTDKGALVAYLKSL